MKLNVKKNWILAYTLITENPIILLPTLLIGFFELLCLELIYFCTRPPLMYLANPIIKKFFGEIFVHYPGNMLVSIKLLRGIQMVFYVLAGVFLYAVTIGIVRAIKEGKTVRVNVQVRKAFPRYTAFLLVGILSVVVFHFENKLIGPVFQKVVSVLGNFAPGIMHKTGSLLAALMQFVTNLIITVFVVLILPLMIIGDMPLMKAVLKSLGVGIRGFFGIFTLIVFPYLIYFPMAVLKSIPVELMGKTFPEITPIILAVDIVIALIIECFVITSVSLCVLDMQKDKKI